MTGLSDTQRLVNEWLEHDKIVLAVDFDDTIYPYRMLNQAQCDEVIRLIKWCHVVGAHIVIHTASDKARHAEIAAYCKLKGLNISGINENPIKLPYGNEGKIYYNWQLCDRSGLQGAMVILEDAAKIVLTTKMNRKPPLAEVG